MSQFIISPYVPVNNYSQVFANNIKIVEGRYRLWKYIYDYDVEQPRLEPIPVKYKKAKGLSLFRYQRSSFFLKDIQAKQLTFVSPELWNDPFESLFFDDKGIFINGKPYYIRCICFTYDWIEGEEASWFRAAGKDELIRIEYDFECLCSELESQNSNCVFYFSMIDYSIPRKHLIKIHNSFKTGALKPSSLEEYLNMLSLKRKAFSYENEIRLFVVSQIPFNSDLFRITYSNNPIKTICFPPMIHSFKPLVKQTAAAIGIKTIQSRLYDIG